MVPGHAGLKCSSCVNAKNKKNKREHRLDMFSFFSPILSHSVPANNMPLPHGRRTRSPYSFSLDELKVLRDTKKKLIGATKKERATLVANGIREVISVARRLHPNLTATRETAIRIAVVKWIRKNSATRTWSQKVGTKQWNPRRVFFELNRCVLTTFPSLTGW